MKIMIFETEKEALEAEREISRVLGFPTPRWPRTGKGIKRFAVPFLRTTDNKWITPAPFQSWCACTENFCCSAPEYSICREATFSVTTAFTIEEIEPMVFTLLQEAAFPEGYEKHIVYR
jgi:hypothetical protein